MAHAADPGRERRWREIVRRQCDSGRTIREFCRLERIAESSFHFWRAELRRRDRVAASTQAKAGAFVPVRVVADEPPETREVRHARETREAEEMIEMALPHGAVLRLRPGFDALTLQRIVMALRDVPGPADRNSTRGERC